MICLDCGAEFSELDQTRSDYRDGKCPYCASERIKEEQGGESSKSS